MMKASFQKEKVGDTDILISRGQKDPLTIIFLHGYNSSAATVKEYVSTITDFDTTHTWIFPEAPHILQNPFDFSPDESITSSLIAPPQITYDVNETELEKFRGWFDFSFNFSVSKIEMVAAWEVDPPAQIIKNLIKNLKIFPKKLIIGGFSQGGMVAAALLNILNKEEMPLGIILSSSFATQAHKLDPNQVADVSFLITHGAQDCIAPVFAATATEAAFLNAGMTGKSVIFEGEHVLNQTCLSSIAEFINHHSALSN
ncbi:hypothetical protein CLAVI_000845 [Candidatus Clavichlamydia salmonicola]|uniref:alpha/beta hydrolase n=1 Tax=Candidatus Clavichlamydia salmonicola TaxID=469812 RepID=UPI0018915E0D|nr:hypothetical protein [Candidatus Clavichlamydia salmonicola]MBF5051207.1 hypothetical protein [Candidatus Clavichlamydia salmonicola]